MFNSSCLFNKPVFQNSCHADTAVLFFLLSNWLFNTSLPTQPTYDSLDCATTFNLICLVNTLPVESHILFPCKIRGKDFANEY